MAHQGPQPPQRHWVRDRERHPRPLARPPRPLGDIEPRRQDRIIPINHVDNSRIRLVHTHKVRNRPHILWQMWRSATICGYTRDFGYSLEWGIPPPVSVGSRQLGGTEGQATVPQILRDRQSRGKHRATEPVGPKKPTLQER
jgi:hypothetical protein